MVSAPSEQQVRVIALDLELRDLCLGIRAPTSSCPLMWSHLIFLTSDDGSTSESCSEAFENYEILCKCTVIHSNGKLHCFVAIFRAVRSTIESVDMQTCDSTECVTVSFLFPPRTAAGNGEPTGAVWERGPHLQPSDALSRVHGGRPKYSWRCRGLGPASALFWSSPK